MANKKDSKISSSEGVKVFEGADPWKIILQMVEMMKSESKGAKMCSPPNFMQPFADPDVFQKLKNDRRTREWCKDPEYMALIKELHEDGDKATKACTRDNSAWRPKVLLSLRVLLCGKDRSNPRHPDAKPGSGFLLLPDFWFQILSSQEGGCVESGKEKDAGNAAYQAGNHDKALKHYKKAIKLFPYNMACFMNIGAVHFATQRYSECIKSSLEAVEVGRENGATGNLFAKAYRRIGNSYKELGDSKSAKEYYEKSLVEADEPEKEIPQKVTKVVNGEKMKLNLKNVLPNQAKIEVPTKESGNKLFRQGNFTDALIKYTKTIKLNPDDPSLYFNRAACYVKLLDWDFAMEDLDKCLEMDRSNAQGWLLKARILQKQASCAYMKATELDSSNAEAAQGYQQCVSVTSSVFETLDVE